MMKRFLDIVFALSMLVLLSPIILVVAALVAIKLGRPILFFQVRPGLNAKPFPLFKFRSMTDKRNAEGELLPDNMRLTRFGKLLRSTSLDELPSLINVLRGDMSLVGPRPLLIEYVELYSAEQSRRHEVRPGITGWAQVNGRNALTWTKKFELDVWYVDNQSIFLDLKILLMTFFKVINRDDISHDGEVTMSRFTGNQNDD